METRVLTVPVHSVNDELAVRQVFGWQLSQTSARSFATGGGMVGVGAHVGGGLVVGGGQVMMNNAHFTDLVLQRPPGARSQWLAGLEEQYDSVSYKPNAPYWVVAAVAAVVFIVGLMAGAAISVALGNGEDAISPYVFIVPLFVGIGLGVLARLAMQRRRTAANQAAEAYQMRIINQARGTRS
jgi:hypothetical protein